MTIAMTAYDTPPCKGYVMERAIQMAEKDAQYYSNNDFLYALGQEQFSNQDIPTFMHPVVLNVPKVKNPIACIDVRHYGSYVPKEEKYVCRNHLEYMFATVRGKLQYVWANQSPAFLRNVSTLPVNIFSKWISENVARRYSLDPMEQMNLMIAAAIYYQSCFEAVYKIDDNEMVRLTTVLARAIHVKADAIIPVIDMFQGEEINFDSFMNVVKQIAPIRLKDFNPALLHTVLARSWFNSNGPEVLIVALYHPPTWIAVVLACIQERTYHNSAIAKLVQRIRDDSPSELIHGIKQAIDL